VEEFVRTNLTPDVGAMSWKEKWAESLTGWGWNRAAAARTIYDFETIADPEAFPLDL